MRKSLFISLAIIVMGSSTVHAQSLRDLIELAVTNNPEVKSKYIEFKAALERVAQVNALPDPKISFGVFVLPVETRLGPQQAKIGLSQMFPWFGTLSSKGDVAATAAQIKYQQFIEAQQMVAFRLKQSYYPLLELDEMIKIQQENLSLLHSYKQLALTSVENGRSNSVDVIRVDIMITKISTDISVLEEQRPALLASINSYMNRELNMPVYGRLAPIDLDVLSEYRKDSLLDNQRLKILDAKQKMLESKQVLVRKMGMPQLGLGLDYVLVSPRSDMSPDNNGRDVIMPMASLSIPLQRAKYTALTSQTQLESDAVKFSKADLINQIAAQYERAQYKMNRATLNAKMSIEQIDLTSRATALLITQYSTDGKNFEEVLSMQLSQLKYQTALVKARAAFWISKAEIDYLTSNDF